MSAQIPPLLQDSGVPFDLFIQALTEQLDKAQAGMAIKARLGKLPLTFAVRVAVPAVPPSVRFRPSALMIAPSELVISNALPSVVVNVGLPRPLIVSPLLATTLNGPT